MANATQSGTIFRESFGSLKLHIIPFSNIENTNTYASGLTSTAIVGYWGNITNGAGSTTMNGVDITKTGATFQFNMGEEARTGTLYVLTGKSA